MRVVSIARVLAGDKLAVPHVRYQWMDEIEPDLRKIRIFHNCAGWGLLSIVKVTRGQRGKGFSRNDRAGRSGATGSLRWRGPD
jgi:hypothetical protein